MKEIQLTRGCVALVDDEDLEILSNYSWYCLRGGYAAASVGGRKNKRMIYMHRLILNLTDPKLQVDHINHNPLDNRKENLRVCSHNKNGKNLKVRTSDNKTSKYKGVYWDKSRNKWTSRIKVNYKGIFLGRFVLEQDAAVAYNQAAIKYFGDYACLNQI